MVLYVLDTVPAGARCGGRQPRRVASGTWPFSEACPGPIVLSQLLTPRHVLYCASVDTGRNSVERLPLVAVIMGGSREIVSPSEKRHVGRWFRSDDELDSRLYSRSLDHS